MTTARYPDEASCRRPGWTEGEAVRLANGQRWHFPAIGDHLIPSLPTLVPMADAINDELFLVLYAKSPIPPGFARVVFAFIRAAMGIQYDVPPELLRQLVAGYDEADGPDLIGTVDRFLHYLLAYATNQATYSNLPGFESWLSVN